MNAGLVERVAAAIARAEGWKGDSLFPDADFMAIESSEELREHYRKLAREAIGDAFGPQPIETVPRDGTEILLWISADPRGFWALAECHEGHGSEWRCSVTNCEILHPVTHWAPLPENPK